MGRRRGGAVRRITTEGSVELDCAECGGVTAVNAGPSARHRDVLVELGGEAGLETYLLVGRSARPSVL